MHVLTRAELLFTLCNEIPCNGFLSICGIICEPLGVTTPTHSIDLLLKILRCEWTTQYIDPPPQTFEDAIQVYKSLPAKSLEDERVVSFSIAPLSDYCGVIDEILNSISDQNIEFVTNMLVDFEAVDKVLRRLKSTKLASDFLTYRSILLDLERRFELKRSKFIYRIQGGVD